MNDSFLNDIRAAKSRIIEAEHALDAAIAATEGRQRADKVTIDIAVGEALQRLKDANAILDALKLEPPSNEPS